MNASSTVTRQVVEGFLADRLGHWLAHDVAFLDRSAMAAATGRADAVLALEHIFRGAPETGHRLADLHLVVDAGEAAAGWVLECRIPPPDGVEGGPVARVPMAATFEVVDGEIVRLTLLYDRAGQGGGGEGPADGDGNTAGTAGS